MAWVEAACVYYLRAMVDRLEPYQANPLPMHGVLGPVELVREAATLIMLLAVGGIAGRTRATRLGYTAIAFGVWDIFYYVFLKIIYDWPKSLLDWDILFLIPLPWWGPVIAPISIALLMIVWGTLVTRDAVRESSPRESLRSGGLQRTRYRVGALRVHGRFVSRGQPGSDRAGNGTPTVFNWPLFALAVTLMAAPVAQLAWRLMLSPGRRTLTS